MKRIAKKTIVSLSDINATKATSVTYFPYPEYVEKVAYSAGVHGWTGSLYRGTTSGLLYAVRTYPGSDGNAGFILLIALCVAEIRDNGSYRVCAGSLECIQPEQQLHKFVVGIKGDGHYDENILIPNRFLYTNKNVPVREMDSLGCT